MRRRVNRPHKASHCLFALLLFCTTVQLRADIAADSLRYIELRRSVSPDVARSILETADLLAQQQLFSDATEILSMIAPQEIAHTDISQKTAQRWRVGLGADYYHLEDVDTVTMTQEEYQDYLRLTSTPMSLWGRGRCVVDFNRRFLNQAAPEIYLSNNRSSFEMPVHISLAEERLALEASLKAGKWFTDDATDTWDRIHPMVRHASDMVGGTIRIAPERSSDNSVLSYLYAPLSVDWEGYRDDRSGYESYVEYRFSPGIELRRKGTVGFVLRLLDEVQYEDYYRPQSDSLDVIRNMLLLECAIDAAAWHIKPKVEWLHDQYPFAGSPFRTDRFKAALRLERESRDLFSPRMEMYVLHEREAHSSQGERFTLPGSEVRITPGLVVKVSKALSLEPEISYQYRAAQIVNNSYLWLAHSRFDALMRAALAIGPLEATLFAGFRGEDVTSGFERVVGEGRADSRSFILGSDIAAAVGNHTSVSLLADYEYRCYAPYGRSGRLSENLTISGNLSFF